MSAAELDYAMKRAAPLCGDRLTRTGSTKRLRNSGTNYGALSGHNV